MTTTAIARPLVDRAEIARAVRLLHEPDEVIELRALEVRTREWKQPHSASGYFDRDHRDALIEGAAEWSPNGAGFSVAGNFVNPALLPRAANRIENGLNPTTGDTDTRHRRWLLMDLDPQRPNGISATETEHNASREL